MKVHEALRRGMDAFEGIEQCRGDYFQDGYGKPIPRMRVIYNTHTNYPQVDCDNVAKCCAVGLIGLQSPNLYKTFYSSGKSPIGNESLNSFITSLNDDDELTFEQIYQVLEFFDV